MITGPAAEDRPASLLGAKVGAYREDGEVGHAEFLAEELAAVVERVEGLLDAARAAELGVFEVVLFRGSSMIRGDARRLFSEASEAVRGAVSAIVPGGRDVDFFRNLNGFRNLDGVGGDGVPPRPSKWIVGVELLRSTRHKLCQPLRWAW